MAVLILVLVEDGLGVYRNILANFCWLVLILVLVEDGLGEYEMDLYNAGIVES